jgi:hypothetical protein
MTPDEYSRFLQFFVIPNPRKARVRNLFLLVLKTSCVNLGDFSIPATRTRFIIAIRPVSIAHTAA